MYHWLLLASVAACVACSSKPATSDTTAPPPTVSDPGADTAPDTGIPPDPNCGMSPSDWCPSPAGDPCGDHKSEAACRNDPACEGMPYRGESVVACRSDGKGFWSNCPAVGCVSRHK